MSLALSPPTTDRLHSRASSTSASAISHSRPTPHPPVCLIDIFSSSSPPTSRPARASVDYSVASSSSFSSCSLLTPGLSSPSEFSLASIMSLPSPPPSYPKPQHLTRSSSHSVRRAPKPAPVPHHRPHSTSQPPPAGPRVPSRSERLLLATLQRADAACASSSSPPRRSSSSADDEVDWLAEIREQTCMRPSRRAAPIGKTTSLVHVARPPSPRRRHPRPNDPDEGATFRPGEKPSPAKSGMGTLMRSVTSVMRPGPSARSGMWLEASPSPAGALAAANAHSDWPWEPTTSNAKPASPTSPPTSPSKPNSKSKSKPPLSRAQTSPATGSSSSSSQPRQRQPLTPPPSPPFDAHSTSLLLKNREGYVSFRDVEGLGAPADPDDEDEKLNEEEREKRGRGRWWAWGWAR